jgi:hypothetical protein
MYNCFSVCGTFVVVFLVKLALTRGRYFPIVPVYPAWRFGFAGFPKLEHISNQRFIDGRNEREIGAGFSGNE